MSSSATIGQSKPDQATQFDRYLTVKQCAFIMNCHPATVWRMVKAGEFPKPFKLGHLTRWSELEVQSHLFNSRQVAA